MLEITLEVSVIPNSLEEEFPHRNEIKGFLPSHRQGHLANSACAHFDERCLSLACSCPLYTFFSAGLFTRSTRAGATGGCSLDQRPCPFCSGFQLKAEFLFFFFFFNAYCMQISPWHLYYLFIYLWLCWVFVSVRGLSLVAASGGHSSSQCAGLSLSRPLLLRSTGSRRAGSVIVAHGPTCSAACGIFPDQGSNPCPLHWPADSQPLRHQGSPKLLFFKKQIIRTFEYVEVAIHGGSRS